MPTRKHMSDTTRRIVRKILLEAVLEAKYIEMDDSFTQGHKAGYVKKYPKLGYTAKLEKYLSFNNEIKIRWNIELNSAIICYLCYDGTLVCPDFKGGYTYEYFNGDIDSAAMYVWLKRQEPIINENINTKKPHLDFTDFTLGKHTGDTIKFSKLGYVARLSYGVPYSSPYSSRNNNYPQQRWEIMSEGRLIGILYHDKRLKYNIAIKSNINEIKDEHFEGDIHSAVKYIWLKRQEPS